MKSNIYTAFRLFFLLTLGVVTSGCSIMHAQSRIDPRTVASYEVTDGSKTDKHCFVSSYYEDANIGVVNLDCAKFPGDKSGKTIYQLATEGSDGTGKGTNADLRKEYRNRLGAILMKHSDDICTASIGRAANNEAVSNTILNSLTTGFASASTIVTGEVAKSILSGAAATSSGVRDHINAEMFRNTLVTAISKAIDGERASMAVKIMTQLSKPTSDYPADLMIMEINRYHQACSYIHGLQLVTTAVDRSALENITNQMRSYDQAITFLQAAMAKEGADKEALQKQLTDLISQRATAAVSLPTTSTPANGTANGQPTSGATENSNGTTTNAGKTGTGTKKDGQQ